MNYIAAGIVILAALVPVVGIGYLTMPSHMRRRRGKGSYDQ